MGESACLLRSLSHPCDASRELREGDPIRALTESVSFGRFMSESLAWEKWSTFSHNRYLEEAEKFAKPGSVAQKKAYFEAHYRRKAAVQEASLVTEPTSAGDVENPTTKQEPTSVEDAENPTTRPEQTEPQHLTECHEKQEEDSSDYLVDVSVRSADVKLDESKSENVEVTSPRSLEKGLTTENIVQEENLPQMRNLDECIEIRSSESGTKDATEPWTLTGGKKRTMSSSKSLDQSKPSKLLVHRAKVITTMEQRTEKESAPSRVKLVVEKKKPASKSLHMSISFASSNVSTSSKKVSPVRHQIRKLKDITASIKWQQGSSAAQKLPARASINEKPKVTSITTKSEERRMKVLTNKSVAGRIMMDKSSSSLSKENTKYSFANGSKGQSPIVCSPFRFRSEERAAKRKEKQEEKVKAMEAEKVKPCEGYWLSTTRPRSPKLGTKSSQGMGPEAKPRPPRQTSYRVDTADGRKGKSNPSARASVLSLSSRSHVRENSSPNIPR